MARLSTAGHAGPCPGRPYRLAASALWPIALVGSGWASDVPTCRALDSTPPSSPSPIRLPQRVVHRRSRCLLRWAGWLRAGAAL